ncbi:MAG: glyoxalase [Rhodospirillales bacterium 69-11]|nr:VOC family protein [Rhodospirillales bacterium]MBN8902376.1 VOC family protein [Rhodospirillales bacterium]MBN8929830.1 VOC family protein [Rhodospirillales bacterium]OJW25770.1 MAG: glyoxalase [Rhodospirillales bacterium 69-11]
MAVKRIVANIATQSPDAAHRFYADVLGLELAMDHGWILTFAARGAAASPQVSVAVEGGSGTGVPDLSVEVDDLADVLRRATDGGFEILYGPVWEPWGVTRFYVRDPFGRVVNVLAHED